ncbi:MAG: fumarylacetoacetate hydrolase [Candidatus Dactylopiibacterium carminicum]|nr:MAG: fumarylacetoacetate hydrolase [Candidatus Dactylopiibacterium carminicum]
MSQPFPAELVFPVPAVISLPVAGSDARFPVRRVYCVGRNYLDHIREMGNDERQPPVFFSKPRDAVAANHSRIPYAQATSDLHYELELAVGLHSGGQDIPPETALTHVFGYAVALDMTRRDLQRALSAKGSPWDVAKGFDNSCPCAAIHPASTVGHPSSGNLELRVNDEIRQKADLAQMIWDVPNIIAYLSRYFTLAAGDLILTGTPAGVGPVKAGDRLEGRIDGLETLYIDIV